MENTKTEISKKTVRAITKALDFAAFDALLNDKQYGPNGLDYMTRESAFSVRFHAAYKKAKSLEFLRRTLKPGDTVKTVLMHVSRSGMYRVIKVMTDGGEDISWDVANVLGWPLKEARTYSRGIGAGGCGMDMGFHLVYTLSSYLFPKGFKVDGVGRDGDTSGHDTDGGYALKQRWI